MGRLPVALPWSAQGADNITQVEGQVTLDGQAVAGAQVAVGGYRVPEPTDEQGRFSFPADHSIIQRYPVQVVDAANATVNGSTLSEAQQAALTQAQGGINVSYVVTEVQTSVRADGAISVTGAVQFDDGTTPPPVVLYSYRLTGTVQDTSGQPVEGMLVGVNSQEFRWTFSEPTDAQGNYTSLYWPTDPRPFNVLLIQGNEDYPIAHGQRVLFPLYNSAGMDVTLDRSAGAITVTKPALIDGRIYDALLVGLLHDGEPVQPISATWPMTDSGQFTMVLPADLAGQTVAWWQWETNYFAAIPAEPGGQIDLSEWPESLPPRVPRGFAAVTLPEAE